MLKWLYFPQWLPENVSTYGGGIDNLFVLIYWITAIAFLGVMIALIVFIIK
jgi:cytochrome c oxidase subunit II